jgi:hypothetical protein
LITCDRELEDTFRNKALQYEIEVQRIIGKRGRPQYQVMAANSSPLDTAIRLIGDGKKNTSGYIRLLESGLLRYSLESLFLEFYDEYGMSFSHKFPEKTVKVAKAKLGLS